MTNETRALAATIYLAQNTVLRGSSVVQSVYVLALAAYTDYLSAIGFSLYNPEPFIGGPLTYEDSYKADQYYRRATENPLCQGVLPRFH